MPAQDRYELLGLIGNGDFAAVYRVRYRELGRDVAVKQIHGQYMNDPRRLERFWREAQLLASLQHPHILTIYDVVRKRGWLVLELMQGTLLDACKGQPIDLALLRSALVGSLEALTLLHANNVLHGDIKPSNLLLDKHRRVKLGDFGLARRVASDQGSYLKGATRYMAPELVAPQFGRVGPRSDLYSLGFTAYELLCGPNQFESLFPGLDAFGRDRQIAWMMWHAAADRRLPPVASVLDGVPPDLARVIDGLTVKDPAKRYQSAEQALAQINRPGGTTAPPPPTEDKEAANEAKRKKKRRLVAMLALAASLLVSVAVAVIPTGKKPEPPPPAAVAVRGVVRTLLPERQTMVIEQPGELGPKEIAVRNDDRVLLNGKMSLLRELKEADQVTIEILKDEQERPIQEIRASRPQEDRGVIAAVNAEEGELTITPSGGGSDFELVVNAGTAIALNGMKTENGQAHSLQSLVSGDRVVVTHYLDQERQTAIKMDVQRVVNGEGVLRAIDLKGGELSIAASADDTAAVSVWKLSERPEVTLNGRRMLGGRLLTPADLKAGDRVKYERDLRLVSIAAQRQLGDRGTIRAIRYDVRSITATNSAGERVFVVVPECPVTLGGEMVTFDDLRVGDMLDVTFDEPDAVSPAVQSIAAQRPPDPKKWAIVIVGSAFDDGGVAPYATAAAEAAKLREILTTRYAVPSEQLISIVDASRVRLEQQFPDAVARTSQAGQLLVVVAGRTAADGKSPPLFAPRDFSKAQSSATGIPLADLLAAVEKSSAEQKIVVLDLAPADAGSGPAAAEQVDAVRGTRSRPLLKTTYVIATDRAAAADASAAAGLVAQVGTGVAGAADGNRDNLCTVGELHDFLKSASNVSVRVILPETTPPRLTDDAKDAIRRIVASVSKQRIDLTEAKSLISSAEGLAQKEPEPKLAGAILLAKGKDFAEALNHLEAVIAQNPKLPLAWEVSAWSRFEMRNYSGGLNDLSQLIRNLPSPMPETERRAMPWVGRLREFCGLVLPPERRPPQAAIDALDAAIAARTDDIHKAYRQGRDAVMEVHRDFERQLDQADETRRNQLKFERLNLRHYASFSLEGAAQQALATLEAD